MAAATLSPTAKDYFWNIATGAPLAGGLVYTVTAGGAFPGSAIATYQDSNALIPNTNPIVLNAAGYATIYLQPGKTYKYIVTDANGVLQFTQDGIEAVPTTNLGLDIGGAAGDSFALGQVAYLSDGSGGKTAGLWYLADSANAYSSTLPIIAMPTTALSSGSTGTFRQGGILSGLSGLIAGSSYYVGTSGALTAVAPTLVRLVGVADNTTTQLDIIANPPPFSSSPVLTSPTIKTSVITPASGGLWFGVCQGRLTGTTVTPVTVADVTNIVTIFFTPYLGNNIGLYDGTTNWTILPFTEISVALGTLTSGLPYDLFAFNNSGVVALRSPVAWTSTTARATALVLQNGVLVKSGATTDRYLGTFYTTSTTQTQDTGTQRYLWNYYNRVRRPLLRMESTASWSYTTATWRQANAAAANQVEVVVGVAEALLDLRVSAAAQNTSAHVTFWTSIGEDSTTAPMTTTIGGLGQSAVAANGVQPMTVLLTKYVPVGRHVYAWLEDSTATGTTTWFGVDNAIPNGLNGSIEG